MSDAGLAGASAASGAGSPVAEPLPPVPDGAADGLQALLLAMADDELVIGWSDSEWTGIAPLLEEDVAMSSLAQDELGHATALYDLLAAVTGQDRDAIAFDRAPEAYRHARLLDHGRGDWAMTIARRALYESADAVRLEALADGSWPPLAELVRKMRREERYHAMHVGAWLDRLAATDGEPRRRLVDALTELGPDAGTVYTPLTGEPALVEAGILRAPMADLEATWRDGLATTFGRLDLPLPPATRDPERGRLDHGAAFAWLHREMTAVRATDPGATW
jgi:ring-1,2-phenylacetyl-CoA epoxidase subunit PaaC